MHETLKAGVHIWNKIPRVHQPPGCTLPSEELLSFAWSHSGFLND